MKTKNSNEIRTKFTSELYNFFKNNDEDVGLIASNSFNFPIVAEDGEEGWIEIVVKVTKESGDDGYMKREQYNDKIEAAKIREKNKAEKVAKAKN